MVIVLFGVTGAGKSTIGRLLAEDLGWAFIDADDFHPPANVKKMSSGIPLDDSDREGWLRSLAQVIHDHTLAENDLVLACSALKKAYRNKLAAGNTVRFIYLKADPELTAARLAGRSGHYMNPSLLESQFGTLEEPDESTITIDTCLEPNQIVRLIKEQIIG